MTHYAGFDIGGTNARLALFDEEFKQVGASRRRIRDATEPESVVEAMVELVAELHDDEVTSVGIGIAAQLGNGGEVVVNAPNLGWRDVPFADLVRQAISPEVGVYNDLSALLWGERHAGAAQGCDDVLAAFVGTGFGGAILAGGELIDGAGGKAGEIGHCKVEVNGRMCGCGQRGCAEAYVSGVHLERQLADLGLDIDLAAADDMARKGNGPVHDIWRHATDLLAITIANAVTLLNPSVLLLGGGVLDNLGYFREETLSKILPQVLAASLPELEVRFAELGDEAGVLGAALLAAGKA